MPTASASQGPEGSSKPLLRSEGTSSKQMLRSSFSAEEEAEYERMLAAVHSEFQTSQAALSEYLQYKRRQLPTSKIIRMVLLVGAGIILAALGVLLGMLLSKGSVLPDPNFVCHGDEVDVDLDTACWRIGRVAKAGARRRLTGVSTLYSCLPHYRLAVHDTGGRVTFPYHSNIDLLQGGKQTMAMMIIHGAMRDADSYFCMMYGLIAKQRFRDPSDVLIIAPDYNYHGDIGLKASDAYWNKSKPWGDWRAGAHSHPESSHHHPVSSYQVLDTFMLLLNNTDLFPSMNEIALIGHSAGGQMVQRYALATHLPPRLRDDLDLRFIVANPSSYAYLNSQRPKYSCGDCDCSSDECDCSGSECHELRHPSAYTKLTYSIPARGFDRERPGGFVCGHRLYDHWPYGLLNRLPYPSLAVCSLSFKEPGESTGEVGLDSPISPVASPTSSAAAWRPLEESPDRHSSAGSVRDPEGCGAQSINKTLALYPERDVVYLVGENDTCNDNLPFCESSCWQRENACFRNEMDTRCPAMLEGPWRKMRGELYYRFLHMFYGRRVHHFGIVHGSGHNATAMFYSETALMYIFHLNHTTMAEDPWEP